jgi:DNA-binding NarL/FixJ family response regulator
MFKILIVEDNRFYREALRESVKARFPEVTVDEAVNGKEAIEKVNSLCPDLIFMDLRLPDESGLELTKKIRAAFANTSIIVLTSYDLPEYKEAATRSGANCFFAKNSTTEEELLTLVKSFIAGSISGENSSREAICAH